MYETAKLQMCWLWYGSLSRQVVKKHYLSSFQYLQKKKTFSLYLNYISKPLRSPYQNLGPEFGKICSDEGLMLQASAFKLITVASLLSIPICQYTCILFIFTASSLISQSYDRENFKILQIPLFDIQTTSACLLTIFSYCFHIFCLNFLIDNLFLLGFTIYFSH